MKKSGRKPIPVRIVHDSPSPVVDSYRPKDSMHMSIRQIKNGYIVNKHGNKDGKHFDDEFYTPKAPNIDIGDAKKLQRSQPARGVNRYTKL
jgi:hypothetical protein